MQSLALVAAAVGSAGLLGGSALPTRFAQPARVAASRQPHIRSVAPSPEAPGSEAAAIAQNAKRQDRLNIRIDDEWYDLTNWRAAHPAGAHWIDAYKNEDATEVMYGFHSDKAMGMIKRLPRSKEPPVGVHPPVQSSYAFREFRAKLLADGWYKPHWRGELQKLLPWATCLWIAKALTMRGGGLAGLGAVVALAESN